MLSTISTLGTLAVLVYTVAGQAGCPEPTLEQIKGFIRSNQCRCHHQAENVFTSYLEQDTEFKQCINDGDHEHIETLDGLHEYLHQNDGDEGLEGHFANFKEKMESCCNGEEIAEPVCEDWAASSEGAARKKRSPMQLVSRHLLKRRDAGAGCHDSGLWERFTKMAECIASDTSLLTELEELECDMLDEIMAE